MALKSRADRDSVAFGGLRQDTCISRSWKIFSWRCVCCTATRSLTPKCPKPIFEVRAGNYS